MEKKDELDNLFKQMSKCNKCKNLKSKKGNDQSLINIFEKEYFYKNIPSIWTDWYNRLASKIMLVGQDWGPFIDMNKFHKLYINNPSKENWKDIIEQEKSMTKRLLTKYLVQSAKSFNMNISLDDIYITNAIMCARKGNNYRGSNINLKVSTCNCSEFLKKQIDIVKPKIILTLGYYPIYSLSMIYDFKICSTLTETIETYGKIILDNFVIIPLYHPASQIKKEIQLNQYMKIWDCFKK